MGLGAIPQPTVSVTGFPWDVAVGGAIVAGLGYVTIAEAESAAARGMPYHIRVGEENIPTTTIRQGSNVPQIVRSHAPGVESPSQFPSRSGRSRNHIEASNVSNWQEHSYPSNSSSHIVRQLDRQGENVQRASIFDRNSQNPHGWVRGARFDMEGPPHGNVPTPHVQKGKNAEPLDTRDPIGHLIKYSREKK